MNTWTCRNKIGKQRQIRCCYLADKTSDSFVIWLLTRQLFQGGSSAAVLLSSSVASYEVFVLSLFVPHLSFLWCLRKAVLRGCTISWASSLVSLNIVSVTTQLTQLVFTKYMSGPSCSKLTMSLVNDSLKFTSSDMQIN